MDVNSKGEANAMAAHDHASCIRRVISEAEESARAAGLNFTPVRKRSLEILLESHSALKAYDLLERLKAEGFGSQPPVAYRALEFLVEAGFAHRIERLNAFVACMHPGRSHAPAFMICRKCNAVAEMKGPEGGALSSDADAIGFEIERTMVEAEGVCPLCREGART